MSSWGKPSPWNLKPVGHVPGAAPAPSQVPKPKSTTSWPLNLAPVATSAKKPDEVEDTKPKAQLRAAAGKVWEDPSLADWDPSDFRVFVGNLSSDVTEQLLRTAFSNYASLTKVRVVKDSKTGRHKGYGFVAFSDAAEYARAMKEMAGKYIGSKPVKLTKSSWKDRNTEPSKTKTRHKPY